MFILNRNEEIVAVLSGNADDSGCHFFNAILTLELNKGASLTFEVDSTESDVVEHIKEENMVVVNDGENYRLLIIKEVSDIHEDSFIKEVYCEDASAELIDEIIYDELSGKVEMGIVLASILKGTRWEIGEVDNTYIRNLKSEYKLRTVLNGIQTLAKDYDAEIDYTVEFAGNKIVARKVHMKKAFGRTLGKRFEFGKDINSIKRTISTADIKTAVVPFGATDEETGEVLTIKDVSWSKPTNSINKPLGQIYIEDEEATELWGYKGTGKKKRPRWIAITFEDCTDEKELLNYAYLQLNRFNKPKVSYEAEVNDLYRMSGSEDYAHEKVGLGDLCSIIDHNFVPALALESRVVKLELNLNDTSSSKVTLGTIVKSIVDKDLKTQIEELNMKVRTVASNVDLSDIENRLDSLESETGTGKWEQIQQVNNLLFSNTVGYHYMDSSNGIWVFDKPVNENPTKAVALKGGCIGLAKWDSQKQEWNVGTFIDGNSVNASMITTGTLKADRIESNALTVNHFNQELKTIINSVGDKPSKTEVTTEIKTAVDEINLSVSTKYLSKGDATNTYATKSSLTQTSNSITASFSSSGGSNVIRNSQFKNGLTYWTNWGTCTRNIGNWNRYGAKCDTALQMCVTGNNQGVQQNLENLAISQAYTIRATVYVGSGQPCIMFNRNNTWQTWTWPTSNGTGKWHEIAFEYTPTTSTDTIYIGNSASGKAGTFYFTSISMTLGVMKDSATNNVIIPNWTPHPSEIYDGSTVIDASGVTIKNGALKVQNNAGQTVLSGDSSGNLGLKSIGTGLSTDIASGKMTLTNTSTGAHMDLQGTTIKLYDTSTIDERAEISKTIGDLTISSWSQVQTPTISLNTDTVKVSNNLHAPKFGIDRNTCFYGGGKDAASWSGSNIHLQCWWGFGIHAYDNKVRTLFDARSGDVATTGNFYTKDGQGEGKVGGFEPNRGSGLSRLAQANNTGDLRLELFRYYGVSSGEYLFASSTFYGKNSPTLGASSYRWGQVYSTSGSISTSDSKVKENIKPIVRSEAKVFSVDEDKGTEATSYDFYNYVKGTGIYTFNYKREYSKDGQTWLGVLADEIPDNIFDKIGMMSKSEEDYQKELQEQEEALKILEATPTPLTEDEDKDFGNRIVEGTELTYRELKSKAEETIEEPIRMINSSSQIAMLQEVLSIALNKIEALEQKNLELEKDLEEIKRKLDI